MKSVGAICVILATVVACAGRLSAADATPATRPVAADGLPIYLEPGKTPADYRNVAVNPAATADEKPASYPHATSNDEYNKKEFAARCAIDGKTANKDVHGCGSWGPHIEDDVWWKLDFGRSVEIDKITIYIRAAFGHDNYWHSATIEFSDGSKQDIKLEKTADPQTFAIDKRTVTWLRITNLKQSEPKKWCALCEVQVWGRDAK
jgi:hypothetical protein